MIQTVRKVSLFVGLIVGLLLFLISTDPDRLPLLALFIPFLLLYFLMFIIFNQIGAVFLRNIKSDYRRWIVGSVAILPVALLLTMSAGQTDFKDFALFIILTILVIFYFSRTNFLR